MSRQSHKPCPPPHFFLSLQKQLSMRLPPLATQAPTSHIFVLLSLSGPPAPVANASTSLPLLAAQADQALQPFFPEYYKLCGLQPKQAWSCLRLQHVRDRSFPRRKSYRLIGSSPPPSKAPAIRRTTQPSPWLQYGAASLPAPPRLTPPSAAARLHTLASKAATTFSSLLTRSISRKLDRGRNPSSSHQRRRHYPTTFKQVRSPRPLQFSPVRGISKFLPSTRISDHSKQEPQITLLAARPNLHSLKDRPSGHRTAAAGPRPAWAAPRIPQPSAPTFLELPPSASSQLSPAKCQPSPPQAASPEQARLRQRHTATRSSDQRTPPLPMARSSATHGQPYSISASPGARLPPPFTPPSLRPPSSFRLKLTPIIDPNTSHSPPPSTQSAPSPEPPFLLFLPPRLYPYLQTH